MLRNIRYNALVLKVKAVGQSHREAWFLSAESGILHATVFGGPRSHLKGAVAPFHQGNLLLYYNPVKDYAKVTEFDVCTWRPGLREDYQRLMAAFALTETILSSYGSGGTWHEALNIAEATLDAYTEASEQLYRPLAVHFLWHWISLLGLNPSLEHCDRCGALLSAHALTFFVHGSLVCESCTHDGLALGAGARRWLHSIGQIPACSIARYSASPASISQAKNFVTVLLRESLGKRIQTWEII
ncbi:MAG: DNA repair protein RecO [Treponema sp.]|jgi:DNA repair protein RecO (recombination protein O)|nr:DNA repair protein RecO [Treponema sp.]